MTSPSPKLARAKRRVLLHAGFHKTGTSTLQDFLRENGDHMAPLWRVETLLHNPRMRAAAQAARRYSLGRKAADLALFKAELVLWLGQMQLDPRQGIMISSEDFAGHMPGVGPVRSYSALGPLISAFVELVDQFFDGQADFSFLMTTRESGAWMRSLYWQQSKGADQKLDFADFAARLPQAADHAAVVDEARALIAPWPIALTTLEDVQHRPFGPAEALLDLADLPPALRKTLRPVVARNTAPSFDLAEQFVVLNRLELPPQELKRRKDDLRRAAVPNHNLLR